MISPTRLQFLERISAPASAYSADHPGFRCLSPLRSSIPGHQHGSRSPRRRHMRCVGGSHHGVSLQSAMTQPGTKHGWSAGGLRRGLGVLLLSQEERQTRGTHGASSSRGTRSAVAEDAHAGFIGRRGAVYRLDRGGRRQTDTFRGP